MTSIYHLSIENNEFFYAEASIFCNCRIESGVNCSIAKVHLCSLFAVNVKKVEALLSLIKGSIMVRGLLSFIIGMYAGIYISQNYDIPRVDDPQALIKKIKDFADRHKKD